MKWFRFYSEAMHDPKLLALSDRQYRHWTYLLCLANDNKPRGVIPPVASVARVLRMRAGDVQAIVDALIFSELVDLDDNGTLRPHGWETRQRKSDDAAEIKRDQRDKHRHPDDEADEMSKSVHGQPDEVSMDMSKSVHPRGRVERERERDSDSSLSQGAGANGFVPDHPPAVEPSGRESPEAVALVKWAETLGVDQSHESYAEWALSACDYAPASWVNAILRQKIAGRSGKARKPIAILSKILGDYLNVGRCDLVESKPIEFHRGRPAEKAIAAPEPHVAAPDSIYRKHQDKIDRERREREAAYLEPEK